MEQFDFIIVGAGSAGCVLAFRLAEKGHSVCVLEAGPPDSSPYIRIPAGFMKTYTNPALTWNFAYQGTAHIHGRPHIEFNPNRGVDDFETFDISMSTIQVHACPAINDRYVAHDEVRNPPGSLRTDIRRAVEVEHGVDC